VPNKNPHGFVITPALTRRLEISMLFEWGGIITVIVEGEEGGVSATQSEIAKIVQATKTDRTMFFK
jgi:hypothetical protein